MIEVLNQQNKFQINKNHFKDLLKRLIEYYGLKDPEVVLTFVNNQEIKKLNQKFLNKNEATDVLSFPLNEQSPDGQLYLGDIIISVNQAFDQSSRRSHSLERELDILTIHGFLHLLGYEHSQGIEEEEEKTRKIIFEGKNAKEQP
ncbi:MAG: rRNA maturation RNase YbeY [Acidobacteriota bacterium]